MYSGNDSTESQNYTQWALNPSAYQNVSSENVDWAALAQQWIIMKEAGPPVPERATAAPVVPVISNKPKKDALTEGGEAPMDMENEKEENLIESQGFETNATTTPVTDSWNWNQQQWGWGNTWSASSGVPPPVVPGAAKAPLLPTPPGFNQFNPVHDTVNENTSYGGYNSVPPNDYTSGYWTAGGSAKIKPHNKRFSKVNPPRPPVIPEPVTLDAAKRKQLPAWIREGLEKMERDKQKQMEKEREKQEEVPVEKMKLSEQDALEIIRSTVKEQRSKFETDGEDSEDSEIGGRALTPEPIPLTQEELMVRVRRMMTEILLSVTNREIHSICKEELQRHLKRIKASDQRVPAPSGTTLSGKLGLGIYGGDSESSSSDSDSDTRQGHLDSDAELKDTIRRRKADFSKTEREIEERLAEAEKGSHGTRSASSEANHNDSQVDAKFQGHKSRFNSSTERTPPPKNTSQNSKRKSRKSSSSDESETDRERNGKLTRKRNSTSSESNSSDKRYKGRSSRNDRTPEHKRSKYSHNNKSKSESGSKRSRSHSKRSRSRSGDSRRRSRSRSHKGSRYSKRSRSRSRSRSKRSHSKSRYSETKSHHKSSRSRSSRSRSRQRRSSSRGSYSRNKRRSRSRHRSSSSSRKSYHYRRSRSSSSSRGKRSHRH